VLVGTAIRATQLAEAESPTAPPATNPTHVINPYLAYR